MNTKNISRIIDRDDIEDAVKFKNGIKYKLIQRIHNSRLKKIRNTIPQFREYEKYKTEFKIIANV